jgi:hypothetical protein
MPVTIQNKEKTAGATTRIPSPVTGLTLSTVMAENLETHNQIIGLVDE